MPFRIREGEIKFDRPSGRKQTESKAHKRRFANICQLQLHGLQSNAHVHLANILWQPGPTGPNRSTRGPEDQLSI